MKCQVLVDWLTFTVKEKEPEKVIREYLGLDPELFQDAGYGLLGYNKVLRFSDICICYEPRENDFFRDMGVCVSMSGNGCRVFETMSKLAPAQKQDATSLVFPALFHQLASDETANISRIDIACDDREGFLNMEEIIAKVQANELNSRMTKRSVVVSYDGTQRNGSTVYIGAPSSDFRVRIYDKALEEGIDGHWVRVELVMRQKNANAFVAQLLAAESVGKLAAQVINDKFSFIERDDSNITRCTVCGWWVKFVGELEARCVIQHSVERVESWVESQVGPSLAILFQTLGWPHIFEIAHAAIGRLSDKQQCLISDYNALIRCTFADLVDASDYGWETLWNWITGSSSQPLGGWSPVGYLDELFSSNKPQKYYTTPTSSVEDQYGNVTNYYRGGDTTNTQIIDSYNHTFNTIHNTTNNTTTNNYKANVRLSDFLNNYTTNNITNTTNNQYTYSADFKSWYYDNTTNNYNYVQHTTNNYNQENNYTYYNTDNSRYYISIDNSTDEYYLVDVQYSPTFVTVNYTYNTTNNKYDKDVGDVTNVYYYELKDGRNSSTLTASEVAGLDVGYDVANYELVTDDPNTLSLQHFDTDYSDSSSYNRTFYSQNRSTNFVDSGAFGKAVSLPNGSAAGVTIPGLSNYSSLSFDFRIYYSDISKLGIYFGDTNLFQEVPTLRRWVGADTYSDDGNAIKCTLYNTSSGLTYNNQTLILSSQFSAGTYKYSTLMSSLAAPHGQFRYSAIPLSSSLTSVFSAPSAYNSPGYEVESERKYGWMTAGSAPFLYSNAAYEDVTVYGASPYSDYYGGYPTSGKIIHRTEKEYRWSPSKYVLADFSYDSYKNQWVSMRITISGSRIYYFVNGDLVGSGSFTKPSADKFYIKSGGGIYLDELRVTTGSLSSTSSYNPAAAPYDTNKVLALPDELIANTIYVQHTTPVTICRVGGVRPSNPSNGFLYIPLHSDYTGAQLFCLRRGV